VSEAAFVFPACSKADAVRILDGLAETRPDQWVASGPAFVWLVDEAKGLYVDWEPEDVASLAQALGNRPQWGLQMQYRLSRRQSMVSLVLEILQRCGGVAVDDFCNHAWTAKEVEADLLISGSRFGEPAQS
jgi:hypothetical protein